jgi:tether containing UBX domain for GLUT4
VEQSKASEDVDMPDTPTPAPGDTGPAESGPQSHTDGTESSKDPVGEKLQQHGVIVFQPPETTTVAAAGFEIPDSDYEVGINELKRIKENYHKEAQPKRLLSDKEIEEKEASARAQMESINSVKIKVRYPDSFTSDQNLDGKSTGM